MTDNGDGSFTANFSWTNPTQYTIYIPDDPLTQMNFIIYPEATGSGEINSGVSMFLPGTGNFQVTHEPDNITDLMCWVLKYGSCLSYNDITRDDISNPQLGSDNIDGSDNPDNELLPGSVVIYRTNEGRFGKFEVQIYGYDLVINWETYNADGTVFTSGQGLTIRGTWHCDLDLGVESPAGDYQDSDFHWVQHNSIDRELVPENDALFAAFVCDEVQTCFYFDDYSSCEPESENPFVITSCVTDMGDGIYTATFYWTNTSGDEITMTTGLENHVYAPGNTITGNNVPMTFISGSGSFEYMFNSTFAEWKIHYPYSSGGPQVNEISTIAEFGVSPICLPDPVLALESVETGATHGFTIYNLDVLNWIDYPYELFYTAPNLPPCGESINSSRSWVSIFADGIPVNEYCELAIPEDLNEISFSVLTSDPQPSEIYITMIDREMGITYISNLLDLSGMKSGLNTSLTDKINPDLNIKVYPNPTGGKITIDFGGEPEFKQLSVVDFLGRVQKFERAWIPNRGLELNISNLSSGIYFVKIGVGDGTEIFKVVKK